PSSPRIGRIPAPSRQPVWLAVIALERTLTVDPTPIADEAVNAWRGHVTDREVADEAACFRSPGRSRGALPGTTIEEGTSGRASPFGAFHRRNLRYGPTARMVPTPNRLARVRGHRRRPVRHDSRAGTLQGRVGRGRQQLPIQPDAAARGGRPP